MFLKFRYRLGYESLCREVSDSISWQRFCRISFGTRVPHPTTLMKITTRCGDDAVAGLNEALLAKAATAKLLRTDTSAPTPPWWRPASPLDRRQAETARRAATRPGPGGGATHHR
jgi:IS5 family transposase